MEGYSAQKLILKNTQRGWQILGIKLTKAVY
jgi:hypothetical protein